MTQEEIFRRMGYIAAGLGFLMKPSAMKIARLKTRMGRDWRRCPCDRDNPERYCGSVLCEEETKKNGVCHCGCFLDYNDEDISS